MSNLNHIGLDEKGSQNLAENLNSLLANYSIFYQNTRGLHWNIKGEKFFELHIKFEELYNDLILKMDEIAERILTLGYSPKHNFSDYKHISEIKESNYITDGNEAVSLVLESFKTLILQQRQLLILSDKINDEGTNALMSDYIREQEKLIWMYTSFLNK